MHFFVMKYVHCLIWSFYSAFIELFLDMLVVDKIKTHLGPRPTQSHIHTFEVRPPHPLGFGKVFISSNVTHLMVFVKAKLNEQMDVRLL